MSILDKKRIVVLVSSLMVAVLFPFQIALYLISRSIVLSMSVVSFFHSNLMVDTILVYFVCILGSIATSINMSLAYVEISKFSIIRLKYSQRLLCRG